MRNNSPKDRANVKELATTVASLIKPDSEETFDWGGLLSTTSCVHNQ